MSKEKIEQTKKAAMVFFFAVAAFLSAWYKFVSPLEKPFHKTLNQTAKGTKATIVIDPGHGGPTRLRLRPGRRRMRVDRCR